MDDTPVGEAAPGPDPTSKSASPQMATRLAVIAAVARNGVIGAGNKMPWHIPAELKHFRALTLGHRIVMGRKTWESIGRPLPGRENVVVTRNAHYSAPGCAVVGSLEDALAGNALPLPVFCIGGAELYAQALPLADEIHLTEIDADFNGDARFPPFEPEQWRECERKPQTDPASGIRYACVHYVRIGPSADRSTPPAAGGAQSDS